jgi:hypothetical protein
MQYDSDLYPQLVAYFKMASGSNWVYNQVNYTKGYYADKKDVFAKPENTFNACPLSTYYDQYNNNGCLLAPVSNTLILLLAKPITTPPFISYIATV